MSNGITLIALVVTIVILIILATVTISATLGDNGLIKQAEKTKDIATNSIAKENEDLNRLEQEYANIIEGGENPEPPKDTTGPTVNIVVGTKTENSIAITVNAVDNESGLATSETYKYYLNGEEKATSESNTYNYTGLTAETEYTIKVEAFDKVGNVGTDTKQTATQVAAIPENISYVGYYADVDGNGSVDGVIYADLAIGGSGEWTDSNGKYTIPKGSNFKKYGISKKGHPDDFGTKDVIKVTNKSGNERFYVMALDDVDSSYHCWYADAYKNNMNDYASTTSTAFGSGKQNTKNMIAKWNAGSYGGKNTGSYTDMWGLSQVQSKINANPAWYVPSKEEWSAFVGELGITRSNYNSKGLRNYYWASSQQGTRTAWNAAFSNWCMDYDGVHTTSDCVRLGATF